jgi:hypothetical protein
VLGREASTSGVPPTETPTSFVLDEDGLEEGVSRTDTPTTGVSDEEAAGLEVAISGRLPWGRLMRGVFALDEDASGSDAPTGAGPSWDRSIRGVLARDEGASGSDTPTGRLPWERLMRGVFARDEEAAGLEVAISGRPPWERLIGGVRTREEDAAEEPDGSLAGALTVNGTVERQTSNTTAVPAPLNRLELIRPPCHRGQSPLRIYHAVYPGVSKVGGNILDTVRWADHFSRSPARLVRYPLMVCEVPSTLPAASSACTAT